MADKIPVKAIFTATDVTALGEYAPGETVPVANGGTGAATLTGVLKGNGTSAFTVATAGTDYVAPGTATTFTAQQTFAELKEMVYDLAGASIDPANGSVQYKALSGNTTFTEALEAGQSITLMIDDGTAYTVTWPTTSWVGGSAPTLPTSGYGVIVLWKISTTLYGKYIGAA